MKIYNLFPLLAGKFPEWSPHFDRAAEMGFDWIFINPVQKPRRSGRLYSIADYLQLNPRFVDSESESTPEAQIKEAIRVGGSGHLSAITLQATFSKFIFRS
jgi:starch synthase (maltosyl-transferring)